MQRCRRGHILDGKTRDIALRMWMAACIKCAADQRHGSLLYGIPLNALH